MNEDVSEFILDDMVKKLWEWNKSQKVDCGGCFS